MIERRALITGLVALVAAPAIVKAASLMKVAPTEKLRTVYWQSPWWEYDVRRDKWTEYSNPLTLDQYSERVMQPMLDHLAASIEREAVLARDFYAGEQWSTEQVGEIVRFRLPNDYAAGEVSHPADALAYSIKEQGRILIEAIPKMYDTSQIPTALGVAALAVAAAPVVEQVLQKPVTRRFWK